MPGIFLVNNENAWFAIRETLSIIINENLVDLFFNNIKYYKLHKDTSIGFMYQLKL